MRGTVHRGNVQHERMHELQRRRIVHAAVDVLAALGYDEITIAQIAGRAGVSRKTFYQQFPDREGCFIAALEEARGRRRVVPSTLDGQEIKSLGREGGGSSGQAASRDMPGFRRTYRTARVVGAIGQLSARGWSPSNREVAEHAGITDSGQIARVLARLEALGLVERIGPRPIRGESNAWGLTAWGQEEWEALRERGCVVRT